MVIYYLKKYPTFLSAWKQIESFAKEMEGLSKTVDSEIQEQDR